MEKLQKEKGLGRQDIYYIDKSFVDLKNMCVRVPVNYTKVVNIYDNDDTITLEILQKIKEKFPKLKFTGEWRTEDNQKNKIYLYYIFFFKE